MPGFMVSGKRHTRGINVGAHGVHGVHGEEELTERLTFLEQIIAKLQKSIEEKDKIIADLFQESKEAEEEAEETYSDSEQEMQHYKQEMQHYKQKIADTINDAQIFINLGFRKALRLQWTQRHQWRGRTKLFPPDAFPNADLEEVGKKCIDCGEQEVLPLEPLDSNGICDECANREARDTY
jgi:hypothetical protein